MAKHEYAFSTKVVVPAKLLDITEKKKKKVKQGSPGFIQIVILA